MRSPKPYKPMSYRAAFWTRYKRQPWGTRFAATAGVLFSLGVMHLQYYGWKNNKAYPKNERVEQLIVDPRYCDLCQDHWWQDDQSSLAGSNLFADAGITMYYISAEIPEDELGKYRAPLPEIKTEPPWSDIPVEEHAHIAFMWTRFGAPLRWTELRQVRAYTSVTKSAINNTRSEGITHRWSEEIKTPLSITWPKALARQHEFPSRIYILPLLFNTLFFFSIIFIPPTLFSFWRIRRRHKKGLCMVCRYDLKGLPAPPQDTNRVCPECGTPA